MAINNKFFYKLCALFSAVFLIFCVGCSFGIGGKWESEPKPYTPGVYDTSLLDYYGEYRINLPLDYYYPESSYQASTLFDILQNKYNAGISYADDFRVFLINNDFDAIINTLSHTDGISIDVINLGKLNDDNFDTKRIFITIYIDGFSYYYVLHNGVSYVFWSEFEFLLTLFHDFKNTTLLSVPSASINTGFNLSSNKDNLSFLFPTQYVISNNNIVDNDSQNQSTYKLKITFEQFANFYKNTGKDDYTIDYENKTIIFDSIKYKTDEYRGVSMRYTSDGEYGSVLCTSLK